MKVRREPLVGTAIQKLVVTEAINSDHYPEECVGYLCPHCMAADEALHLIFHEETCELAGRHGRNVYGEEFPKPMERRRTPELDPRHPINVIEMGETEGYGGLHEGEVLGFECAECGNADEVLTEIVHDEACSLAGRYGFTDPSVRVVAADGGGQS